MAKENFIGKAALEANEGQKRQRIGLKVTGRGIIREHQDVLLGGEKIGVTTSGTHCPYLGYPIAMALVSEGSTELGSKVEVEVRGRKVEAEVTVLPFYFFRNMCKQLLYRFKSNFPKHLCPFLFCTRNITSHIAHHLFISLVALTVHSLQMLDILLPITALLDAPEKINEAPYEAWLVRVKDVIEKEALLSAEEYQAFVESEQ